MSQKRGRWCKWPGYGQFNSSHPSTSWLTYHSTTSLVDKEDLTNDIGGKGIGGTTTNTLEDPSSEQTVV